MKRFLPDHVARLKLEAHYIPMVDNRGRLQPVAAKIEAGFGRFRLSLISSHRRQNNTPGNDDRRRPTSSGNLLSPRDVLIGTPIQFQRRMVGNASSIRASKGGPILGRNSLTQTKNTNQQQNDSTHWYLPSQSNQERLVFSFADAITIFSR